jgi:F-type H+-transporting ATPase subunit a
MRLSPDEIIFWQYGFIKLNATIVFTWGVMFVLAVGSLVITRNLSTGLQRSRWQNLLEIVVTAIGKQIEEVGLSRPHKYLGFLGTIFLFVATANLCTVIPWVRGADGLPLDHSGPRPLCLCRCTAFRHRGARGRGQLPQVLCEADHHHAAV